MAEAGKSGFVDAIVKDPANPPQVKLIVGYVGKSATADHTRIYANPELSEHIDVPDATVLYTQDVPNDPLGAKYVWIQKDADVTRRDSNKTEVRAKFLAGPLAAAAAPAAAPAAQAAPAVSFGLPCPTPSFDLRCPSDLGACQSIDIPCLTVPAVLCNPQPTLIQSQCHTRVLVNCQPSLLVQACQSLHLTQCPPLVTRPIICRTNLVAECHRTLQPRDCFRTIIDCPQITRDLACLTTGTFTGGSAVDNCPSALQCGTAGITFNPLM